MVRTWFPYFSVHPCLKRDFYFHCPTFDLTTMKRVRIKKNHKLAPIRELWDEFIANSCKYYIPHENCRIDQQLLFFRGRCPFRMYMPAKPDKYGMKIVRMNDLKTYYMFNEIPYIGEMETENLEAVPSYYVRK